MDRDEAEIEEILESMADKKLCIAVEFGGTQFYQGTRFAIGILEFQFMPGESTERDKKLAKLIHAYKEAYDAKTGPTEIKFPPTRVITVDQTIEPGHTVHTYDRVQTYIDRCIGCAACATGCPEGAIVMESKPGFPEPPKDGKALREAMKATFS